MTLDRLEARALLAVGPDFANAVPFAAHYLGEGSNNAWYVDADSRGNVYASFGNVIVRFNAFGEQVWQNFNRGAFAVDPSDDMLVVTNEENVEKRDRNFNLVWSRPITTQPDSPAVHIAFDPRNGDIVLAGEVRLSLLGSPAAGSRIAGETDAFVARLSPTGQTRWVRYLGGGSFDRAGEVAVDSTGAIVVVGSSSSFTWLGESPAGTAPSPTSGQNFVVKLNPDGTTQWSTFAPHQIFALAIDADDNILFGGDTSDTGFTGGYGAAPDSGYVLKWDPAGNVVWGNYLGGTLTDRTSILGDGVTDIRLDDAGNVYVAGKTNASNWLGGGADPTFDGVNDAFVARITPDGSGLTGTLFGKKYDGGTLSLAIDAAGNLVLLGNSGSLDLLAGLAETEAPQYQGFISTAFIVKFGPHRPPRPGRRGPSGEVLP